MKRLFLLFVFTTMVASIAGARVAMFKGMRNVPRYKKIDRPTIIGGFASSANRCSVNSNQNNATLSTTYNNALSTTSAVQTNGSYTICTNEESLHSISQTAANTHVGAANTTESGLSVWLYILFGMMALAIIAFIYMLLDDGVNEAPVASRQVFVVTKPSPRIIELANNGGIMIF